MRVLICDDHTLIRAGLRRLIESFDGIEVVAEAAGADEAVIRAGEALPDVVLLDLSMPGRNGFEAMAELHRTCPGCAVVIMSMHDDASHVREALARGAKGFVVKEAAPAELEIALRAAFAGRTFLSPQVERLFGYSVEEWRADPGFWRAHVHPDDLEEALRIDDAAYNATHSHAYEMSYRLIAKSGKVVWVRDLCRAVVEPGRPNRMIGLMIDVTQQKNTELDLLRSENRYSLATVDDYLRAADTAMYRAKSQSLGVCVFQ